MIGVDVYADIVCPWCYIGERRLSSALAQRPMLEVTRRWRPFQLRPEMPAGGLEWRRFATSKFGSWEQAQAAFAHVSDSGRGEGLRFDFDRVRSAPNTMDAHRLVLFAGLSGKAWETAQALFKAYFAEGRDLNDLEGLVALAAEVGLGAEEVRSHLQSDEGKAEVEGSQESAQALGISGVPFYVFNDRYGVSGAQPVETLVRLLDTLSAGAADHDNSMTRKEASL